MGIAYRDPECPLEPRQDSLSAPEFPSFLGYLIEGFTAIFDLRVFEEHTSEGWEPKSDIEASICGRVS